jgi:hypothetical protein
MLNIAIFPSLIIVVSSYGKQSHEGIFCVQWGCSCFRIVIEFNNLMEPNCFHGASFFHGCFYIRSN